MEKAGYVILSLVAIIWVVLIFIGYINIFALGFIGLLVIIVIGFFLYRVTKKRLFNKADK